MNSDERAVEAAVRRFYDAINDMSSGRTHETMREAWLHDDRVTTGHPSGDWAYGWDEVWTTWEIFASFGGEGREGLKVLKLHVRVCGDMAYAAVTVSLAPVFSGAVLECTNVLLQDNGAWKIIHHHADRSPELMQALENLVANGR